MPKSYGQTARGKIESWLENDAAARKWFRLAEVARVFGTTRSNVAGLIAELQANRWRFERSGDGRTTRWRVVETAREWAARSYGRKD